MTSNPPKRYTAEEFNVFDDIEQQLNDIKQSSNRKVVTPAESPPPNNGQLPTANIASTQHSPTYQASPGNALQASRPPSGAANCNFLTEHQQHIKSKISDIELL